MVGRRSDVTCGLDYSCIMRMKSFEWRSRDYERKRKHPARLTQTEDFMTVSAVVLGEGRVEIDGRREGLSTFFFPRRPQDAWLEKLEEP